MEGSSGDEENVICADKAVAGVDSGAFDDGQNVTLHAFAADIGTMATFAAGDFINFIEEDDAIAFDAFESDARDLIHIDELLLFFLDQIFESFGHAHVALFGARAKEAGDDIFEIDIHLFDVAVGGDLERWATFFDVDFDLTIVKLAGAEFFAKLFATTLNTLCLFRHRWQEQFEEAIFGELLGAVGDLIEALFADHIDGDIDEIANHGFDIAADVTDFGELAGFYFEERRIGEFGEAAGDFGFANAGGPNHENVFGHDLFGHFGVELLTADAIAESDGNGAFGVGLTDNVLIEFSDNFARSEFVEKRRFRGRILREVDHHFLGQLLKSQIVVGVDASIAGDLHGFLHDFARIQRGVFQKRNGSAFGERAAGTDGGDGGIGFDDVAGTAHNIHVCGVGYKEESFEVAEHAVGAPFFGEFDDAAGQIAAVLFELAFEAGEEGKGVGGGAGEPGDDFVVVEAAEFFGAAFEDFTAHGDLAVTGEYDFTVAAHAQDGGGPDSFMHGNLTDSPAGPAL